MWTFGTMNYPIFRFLPLDVVIVGLLFGLIRLAFIQQVLLYKKNLTNSGRLVMIGIICEIPGSILTNISGIYTLSLPFPLFLIVGLLLAKYTTKEPLSWIEKDSSAQWFDCLSNKFKIQSNADILHLSTSLRLPFQETREEHLQQSSKILQSFEISLFFMI